MLVEPQPTPLASVLGEQIGALVARLHRAEGVDVRCGVGVAEVRGTDHVEKVGAVATAPSSTPTSWSSASARARRPTGWRAAASRSTTAWSATTVGRTSAPHVWAIGDVASWRDAAGHQVRVEHWSNVADQARVMVPAMLGQDAPPTVAVPYFWSDQYDVKIQCLGEPEADDIVHVVEDDGRKFLAYYERDGVVAGVVGGGMPGKVMKARSKIAAGAPIADVLCSDFGVICLRVSATDHAEIAARTRRGRSGCPGRRCTAPSAVGLLRRLLDDGAAGLAHPGHRGVDVGDRPHRHGHLRGAAARDARPSGGSAELCQPSSIRPGSKVQNSTRL